MEYWKECIESAFDEAEIVATDKQMELVVDAVDGAHENYSMAFGHDCIPNPLEEENKTLRKNLEKEKRKEHCRECDGRGRIITNGPCHSSDSECWKCHGEGKIVQ